MEEYAIPNLASNETGYRSDTGELVAVRVSRRADGAENTVAFEVQGRVVDATGQTVSEGAYPVVAPPHTVSVSLDALAGGRTTIGEQAAAARLEAAERAVRHRAALAAFLALPE